MAVVTTRPIIDEHGLPWEPQLCPECGEETICLWTDRGAPLSCGCALGEPHAYDPPRQGTLFG